MQISFLPHSANLPVQCSAEGIARDAEVVRGTREHVDWSGETIGGEHRSIAAH